MTNPRTFPIRYLDPRFSTGELSKPSYKSTGAAGMDLHAAVTEPVVVLAGEQMLIPTGFAIHLNDSGLAAIVASRSGLALKVRANVAQGGGGIIDSDYTGEISIILENRGASPVTINPNDRIAQLIVQPVIQIELEEVDAFETTTSRGDGGFGSTGV